MAWKSAVYLGCLVPLTGCLMFQNAAHNIHHETVQLRDDVAVRHRLQDEAEDTWEQIAKPYPEGTFTNEFVDGFIDGYVDYLDQGGTAAPPAVAPVKYRTAKYLCPEGHALIRDYLAGFKYGAEVACSSGKRQFMTFPVLLPVDRPPQAIQVVPSPVNTNDPTPTRRAPELAPYPRSADGSDWRGKKSKPRAAPLDDLDFPRRRLEKDGAAAPPSRLPVVEIDATGR